MSFSHALADELLTLFDVCLDEVIVDLVHDLCIVVRKFDESFLRVVFEELNQSFVLQKNTFLENLEVCLGLPEVVDFNHEEGTSPRTYFKLQSVDLWLHLVHGLALVCLKVLSLP